MGEATAEGRLDNCSPRLACLPGVGCRRRNLPPKSGCINYLQIGGWGFYNRSSAVVANALTSRGRRANPVLTYETALRRFFCDTSRRVGQSDDVGNRRWRGSGVPPARRVWCRGESRHATLRFAYRVTEECRRSATRECKPRDVLTYTTALRR